MQKLIYILIFLSFIGCECIPAIDTAKEIKPENGAKIAFYNLDQQSGTISLANKNITLAENLPFASHSNAYLEAFSDYTNIKVTETASGAALYNGIYNLKPGNYYSMYVFNCKRTKVSQVRDSVYPGASFLRIVNVYNELPYFEVALAGITDRIRLKCGDLTELFEVTTETSLHIYDSTEDLIREIIIQPEANTIQNVIILHSHSNAEFTINSYSINFLQD